MNSIKKIRDSEMECFFSTLFTNRRSISYEILNHSILLIYLSPRVDFVLIHHLII